MGYVTYTYYKSIYGDNSMPETDFNRLSWEACRRVDTLTLNKLKFAYPTDPDAIEAVKRCVCKLIEIAYQIEAASKRVSEGQGYVTDDSGALRGKVVSSVSSGSESISYTAKAESGSTLIDAVLSDKTAQEKLYADTVKEYLSMVPDSNGVNLLYRGIPYPYRNAPISRPPEDKPEDDKGDDDMSALPVGSIIIWSGTKENVPDGWHICDGTDGTPDLTDKFVLGAGTAHSVGDTGGEETHTLTVQEIPEHYHTVDANASGTTSGQMHGAVIIKSDGAIKRASSEVGGNKSHNNMPPYYALCYIMKVS